MNILYLTPYLPYPPHSGMNIRSLHLLKALAKHGAVTLVSFGDQAGQAAHLAALRPWCAQVVIIPRRNRHWQADILSWRRKISYFLDVGFMDLIGPEAPELKMALRRLDITQFDLIVTRYCHMAAQLFRAYGVRSVRERLVIDVDDVILPLYEQAVHALPASLKRLKHEVGLALLRRYYQLMRHASVCLVTRESDSSYLTKQNLSRCAVLAPNVVEVNGLSAVQTELAQDTAPEILFCGSLDYRPNFEAVQYFHDRILPQILNQFPKAKFVVVGGGSGSGRQSVKALSGVTLVSSPPEVAPYYQRATLVVVPLLSGVGTKLKLLEAMALKRAVVSTSIGCEGLEVIDGRHVLIADEPDQFAQRCVELLANPQKRAVLASNGYELVKTKYSPRVFEEAVDKAIRKEQTRQLHSSNGGSKSIDRAMKRIGYYLISWGYGGVEMYLLTLLRYLDRTRYEPSVYFYCSNLVDSARMREELKKLSVPVKDVDLDGNPYFQRTVQSSISNAENVTRNPEPGTRNKPIVFKRAALSLLPRSLKEFFYYHKSAFELAQFLRGERLDVIHFLHGGYPTLGVPVIASCLAGIPVRLSDVHLDPTDIRKMRWPQRWRAHKAAMSATHVRALSRRMKQQLLGILPGLKKNRIRVIYNGINLGRFETSGRSNDLRHQLGISPETRLVTTIARLAEVKGHRFLIEAAASLKDRFPRVHYLFVGDGPLRQELEEQADRLGLSGHVIFTGFRDDIPDILCASDIIVLPSLAEGMPLSVLEAMVSGKPIIATDVGSNREVLDAKIGCIVPPSDAKQLALALDALLSVSNAELSAMGKVARQFAVAHHAEERMASELMEFYQ